MLYRIKDLLIRIKYAWQRAVRGYDDRACWNIDYWFLDIMPKILDNLINNRFGYPGRLDDETWDKILKDMKHCFEDASEETCSMKNEYEEDYYETLLNEYAKNGKATWSKLSMTQDEIKENYYKRETEIFEYRNKQLNKGLNLFKKYFWDLWD